MHRLSAFECLSARWEAEKRCENEEEQALWRNACLLARCVRCDGKRAFSDGEAAMRALTPETIACWSRAYGELCGKKGDPYGGWQARKAELKSDGEGRLRWKVRRAFGVLPTGHFGRLSEETVRDCVLQMMLDEEERLETLCPQCREELLSGRCAVCGAVQFGENESFDGARFEELKHGLSGKRSSDAE